MFQKYTDTTQEKRALSLILDLRQHCLLGYHQDLSILKHPNEGMINMNSMIFITMFATNKIHLCLYLYGAHIKVVADAPCWKH